MLENKEKNLMHCFCFALSFFFDKEKFYEIDVKFCNEIEFCVHNPWKKTVNFVSFKSFTYLNHRRPSKAYYHPKKHHNQ